MPPERVCGAVVPWRQEVVHVEHRDLSAATVLAKRGVVDGAMMIHHVDGAAVFAHDEIGRIAEQTPVQRLRRHFAATDDRLGGAVVRRIERGIERNDVQVRESASRREDVPTLAHRLLRDGRRPEKGRHRECETREADVRGSSHVSSALRAIIGASHDPKAAQQSRSSIHAGSSSTPCE